MSSFTSSEKATAPATSTKATSNKANDGDHKHNTSQSNAERPAYHAENIGATPSAQQSSGDQPVHTQRNVRNNTGESPPRRVAWTAVRALPPDEESFAKYLDDGAFVAAGSRPAPPPAPETFVPAPFPTQRDEELLEKGEKLGIHDEKGHGDVVDEVVYKGRGKTGGKEDEKKKVGAIGPQSGKVGEKQESVAGKKKFGSFNAILYGPPPGATDDEKK